MPRSGLWIARTLYYSSESGVRSISLAARPRGHATDRHDTAPRSRSDQLRCPSSLRSRPLGESTGSHYLLVQVWPPNLDPARGAASGKCGYRRRWWIGVEAQGARVARSEDGLWWAGWSGAFWGQAVRRWSRFGTRETARGDALMAGRAVCGRATPTL